MKQTISISKRQEKLNNIFRGIAELTSEREEGLVRFCYSKGYTLEDIAGAAGTTRQALSRRYPDLEKPGKEQS